jgi:exodeoxyribonuclease-3
MRCAGRPTLAIAVLATRHPVSQLVDLAPAVTLPHRVTCGVLDTKPAIAVLGVYVPSRDRSDVKVARKREFISSLLRGLANLADDVRRSLMIVGDYNVVSRRHDPPLRGYLPYEYEMLDELERLGFRACHELRPHGRFPHSWIGRSGAGYLYDYVHLGPGLHDRVDRCAYLHGPRTRGLSDHAGLTVCCRLGAAI